MRGRRTTSIFAVLGLAALAAASLAATPAAARSPLDRVELRAVNVFHTDRIAGMQVSLPRAATIEADPFQNDDVSYSGRGRVVGLVLVEDGEPAHKAFQLISVRWAFCGKAACKPRGPFGPDELTTVPRWGGKRWRIPAGDYNLYVIADGAPATVTLRLHGLTGHTSLHPSESVAGRVAAPTAVANPSEHLFLGRARPMVMPVPGLLIDSEATDFGLGPSAGAHGSCFWRGRGDQDLEHSTPGPHCLRFSEQGGWGSGFSTLGGGGAGWGISTVPAGRWNSSYWSATVAAFPKSEFVTLWLAYEDLAG